MTQHFTTHSWRLSGRSSVGTLPTPFLPLCFFLFLTLCIGLLWLVSWHWGILDLATLSKVQLVCLETSVYWRFHTWMMRNSLSTYSPLSHCRTNWGTSKKSNFCKLKAKIKTCISSNKIKTDVFPVTKSKQMYFQWQNQIDVFPITYTLNRF